MYIVCLSETGDPKIPYAMTYGHMFSDELNSLPNGTYRLICRNELLFAVSEEMTIQINGETDDFSEISMAKKYLIEKPTFNDSTLSITYTIRDSNSTSYTYVTTHISATDVYYAINGNSYKWDKSIYDIQ